jgi:peroxiredoxin
MKKLPLLLAGILLLAIAAGLYWYRGETPGPRETAESAVSATGGAGRMAPAFSLPDISGNILNSSRFMGKPTVINFFATWCPPCREEIPGFVEVYNKYRGAGFELVGISLDHETRAHLPAFLVQNGIEYRILFGDVATAKSYGGVNSIPTTFFVGKDGRIRNVHVGYIDKDTFEREVRKLL